MTGRYANLLAVAAMCVALYAVGASSARAEVRGAAAPGKGEVLQKISFARMLATQSKLAYRLSHSADGQAQAMLHHARQDVDASQKSFDEGDMPGAAARVDEALHLLTEAARRLPQQTRHDYKLQYKELLDAVTTYKDSYDRNYQRMVKARGKDAVGAPLNEEQFRYMVSRARADAGRGDFDKASRVLAVAQRRITKALTVLLKGQTLVYEKKFDSPKDEYRYETRRHRSYADLIPQAIKQHQPTQRARELIHQFVDLSGSLQSHAAEQARSGDYQDAVKTMQEATAHLQRALWIAGVRWSRWPE